MALLEAPHGTLSLLNVSSLGVDFAPVLVLPMPARATAARFCAASFFSFFLLALATRPFIMAATVLDLAGAIYTDLFGALKVTIEVVLS